MSMQKVYWDDYAGQIKTRDGRAVYDRQSSRELYAELLGKINSLQQQVGDLQSKHDYVKSQIQCSAKGHGKWVYQREKQFPDCMKIGAINGCGLYIFKCPDCGLENNQDRKRANSETKRTP
jgi:hypothetical protein